MENKYTNDKYVWLKNGKNANEIDISYTWLDLIPRGWKKNFGEQLLEDIDRVIKEEGIEDYQIIDMKEKWGMLDIYGWPYNKKLEEVYNKYRDISKHICFVCGEDNVPVRNNDRWIFPCCDECYDKYFPRR